MRNTRESSDAKVDFPLPASPVMIIFREISFISIFVREIDVAVIFSRISPIFYILPSSLLMWARWDLNPHSLAGTAS